MSDQFWLDGKVLRKGKEYVGEFAAYEPLLLRELLTDKQAQKAQPPCGADGVWPEEICPACLPIVGRRLAMRCTATRRLPLPKQTTTMPIACAQCGAEHLNDTKEAWVILQIGQCIECQKKDNDASQPAAPKASQFLNFNLTQAMALVESFGGLDGDMAVEWFAKSTDEEGEEMPAGLYAYCYDYPEEGRQWLGDPLAEIEAGAKHNAQPAAPNEDADRNGAMAMVDPGLMSYARSLHDKPTAPVAPATVAVPVPDGVVVAFGLLWHVRMGCDFPVPQGFSKNISPEEAAAKARRFLSDLLTQEQKGDGINRASELLAASQREGGGT